MREFESGATRDTVEGKFDFEGFLSPAVLNRYAEYMNKHRTQADGNLRDSDNWQKGIPRNVYIKSAFRHFFDWWANHRNVESAIKEDVEDSLCALLFNTMGYLHEYLKNQVSDYNALEIDGPRFKAGDKVRIKLGINVTCESMTIPVKKARGIGVYLRKNAMYHKVLVVDEELLFRNDEIFPVEGN